MSEERSIVIILYQYSVVVKGIERRLRDVGYRVDVLTDNFDLIDKLSGSTDIFLLYLPSDILDDKSKQKSFVEICNTVKNDEKKMLILGEPNDYKVLSQKVTFLDDFLWLEKPVDQEKLAEMVENEFSDEQTVVPPKAEKKRILIVDDDPSYAGIVRNWIKDRYKVDIVTAGMQAITFLIKNPVDLVLLDYDMPVADGPQVLMMLRQEEATKHIPVVFLTGIDTKEEVARVVSLKPDGYILQTTTREELIDYLGKKLG